MLLPSQLSSVAMFLVNCRRLKLYLKRGEFTSPVLSSYELSIDPLEELEEEISRCIRGDMVDDRATPELRNIRRQIQSTGERIKQKLDSLLRSHPDWFMESFVVQRNGRHALPVKREYRRMIEGSVIDSSQTGATVFIEPATVQKIQEELNFLHIQEENEVCKVLYALTGLVEDHIHTINMNIEAMETLDFLFAKAKLSLAMKARPPKLTEDRHIIINNGRHPLLDPETVVPLKFAAGNGIDAVVITGPNTGGKTVALKTVGLLSLMAQSGLHVPVDDESLFCINSSILCDIGDGQSIEQNLSTFSSHMTNIIEILSKVNNKSLILLDELGSGTDPTEGMGLAIALLEAFKKSGCLLLATTHYPEIKEFAANTPGFCNARMSFDLDTLLPLYRLEMGIAGESCALHIAERLGLPKEIIQRARSAAYGNNIHSKSYNISNKAYLCNNKSDNRMDPGKWCEELSKIANSPIADDSSIDVEPPEASKVCSFKIGDSIRIRSNGKIGIVYAPADAKGNVGVQVQGRKFLINHKRIKLDIPAEELYPDYPNYDFSIIFDTVENRKARHKMRKRHIEGNIIVTEEGHE
jgi:dsDNA-specific endonuclease/ATPase MutS2